MASPNRKRPQDDGLNLIFFSIPQSILLLTAVPVIVAVLAGKAVAETLQTIGQASEEVFRGERLPVLDFPVGTQPESGSDSIP